jgi:MerR family transcriptional regulator, light-induced transcriptional regulator
LYNNCVGTSEGTPVLRIGKLSRRLGVSDYVLRAWESRYGLLQPARSAGGFRLYTEADMLRVRQMQGHLARGLAAAEAARAVLEEDARPGRAARPDRLPVAAVDSVGALRQALDTFDEPAAQAVFDRLVADLSLSAALREIVLPYLAELGERWQRGTATIAQEHFASNLIRGRLAGLAATLPGTLEPLAAQLAALAEVAPLMLAGAAVVPQLAAAAGARLPAGDPVTAAESVGRLR